MRSGYKHGGQETNYNTAPTQSNNDNNISIKFWTVLGTVFKALSPRRYPGFMGPESYAILE